MASSDAETTPGNLRFFLLGVFATLCVVAVFSLGSRLFFALSHDAPPLVTGEHSLQGLVQTDTNVFWTLTPNLVNVEVTEVLADNERTPSTYRYSTNEMGFRSPPVNERADRFRILAIGDSTTFGQHLADQETWPAQLQRILDPNGQSVEVINAGVIGASSFQGLAFLHTRGFDLKPDLVIATFGFNDWAGAEMSDRERARAYRRRGITGMLNIIAGARQNTGDELVQRASPGEYLDHMCAIAEHCEDRGIDALFLVWPNPFEMERPISNMAVYRPLLLEACRSTPASCLDLLPPFQASEESVFLDSIHATAGGCRIVAQTVATFMQDRYELSER